MFRELNDAGMDESKEKPTDEVANRPEIVLKPGEGREVTTYDKTREYLRSQMEEGAQFIDKVKTRREQLLNKGNLPLSKEDFTKQFGDFGRESNGARLSQKNPQLAFRAAALHAMSCSPFFELICRTSVVFNKDENSFEVTTPMMADRKAEDIKITQENIEPKKSLWGFLGTDSNDVRTKVGPFEGMDGYKVLDAAFIRKFATGAFIDGDTFKNRKLAESLGGRDTREVFSTLLDNDVFKSCNIDSFGDKSAPFLDHFLENYNAETYIATARSNQPFSLQTSTGEEISIKKFYPYSIVRVEPQNNKVVLCDPVDTSKSIELDFGQFKNNFANLQAVQIDHAAFLERMDRAEAGQSKLKILKKLQG